MPAYNLELPAQMLKEIMLLHLTPAIIAGYFMAFTYSLETLPWPFL